MTCKVYFENSMSINYKKRFKILSKSCTAYKVLNKQDLEQKFYI